MYLSVIGCSGLVAALSDAADGSFTESYYCGRAWRGPGCRSGRAAGSTGRRVLRDEGECSGTG